MGVGGDLASGTDNGKVSIRKDSPSFGERDAAEDVSG